VTCEGPGFGVKAFDMLRDEVSVRSIAAIVSRGWFPLEIIAAHILRPLCSLYFL